MTDPNLIKSLSVVYRYPTAPFNEYLVEGAIKEFCDQNGIPYQQDKLGMLWVNKTDDATMTRLLVSHLDHPGIQFKKVEGSLAQGTWLGGSPQHLVGSVVKVFNDLKQISYGTIVKRDKNEITVHLEDPFEAKAGSLWFDELAPNGFQINKNLLYCCAADDLSIVAGILSVIKELNTPILFTRAEEFHLYGITELLNISKLSKDVEIIVLDTTSETEKIRIGSGILLRKGDAHEKYTPEIAQELKVKLKDTKHLESIVKKGQTEGAAFVKAGFKVGSLGIPVRHLHNKNKKKPTHEIVDLKDLNLLCSFLKANF